MVVNSNMTNEERVKILHELWDNSIVGLTIVNESGHFDFVNPALCELLGYTETELKELRFQDVTVPSDRRADEAESQLLIAGVKDFYIMEKSYITKRQSVIRCLLKVIPIRESDGKFKYFISQINRHDAFESPSPGPQQITLKELRIRYGKIFWTIFSVVGYGFLATLGKLLAWASNNGWL
jgi:PAS domain S-box-containing protein